MSCSGSSLALSTADASALAALHSLAESTDSPRSRALRARRLDRESRDLELVDRLVRACFESQDYIEGRRSFMEKRKPRFKGI